MLRLLTVIRCKLTLVVLCDISVRSLFLRWLLQLFNLLDVNKKTDQRAYLTLNLKIFTMVVVVQLLLLLALLLELTLSADLMCYCQWLLFRVLVKSKWVNLTFAYIHVTIYFFEET